MTCHGRIQGQTPVYLPNNSKFTEKLIQKVHYETLHGGVGLTMTAVRERYWMPKLQSLVKSEVIGTDFAGPIKYKQAKKKEGKAYLAIFTCSLSRAIHLELTPSLETNNFITCLKLFIARRGRPQVIYSVNGGTFIKAEKWIRQLRKDERLQGILEQHEITWKFNLSRAPWWGGGEERGQLERLIGVVKSSTYKAIDGATLTWPELTDVLLDVETQINRRPLSYVEDEIE